MTVGPEPDTMDEKSKGKEMPQIKLIRHDGHLVYVVLFPDGRSKFAWNGREQAEAIAKKG